VLDNVQRGRVRGNLRRNLRESATENRPPGVAPAMSGKGEMVE